MGIDLSPMDEVQYPHQEVIIQSWISTFHSLALNVLDLMSFCYHPYDIFICSVLPPNRLMHRQEIITVTERMEHLSMILAMMLLVPHIMKHLALYTLLHRTLILQQALNMPLPHTQSGDIKGMSAYLMLLPQHHMEVQAAPSKHLSLTKLA